MKQLCTIIPVFILLFTLSCKKEEVIETQTPTPKQPEYNIVQVGSFKVAQETLDKWVYTTKKKITFINAKNDTLVMRVKTNEYTGLTFFQPTFPVFNLYYQYKTEQYVYSLQSEKDTFSISAMLSAEPEYVENTTKVCDILSVGAPYIDGKWYWAYMMYKIINVRTYSNKVEQTPKVNELTINGKVYKNVSTAPAINYSEELGIVSFYDTNKVQWSVVKLE
jgi:hypothetical protein